jgi:alpha-tubulin suppressor-like RCC1 family protein
MAVTGGGYHTAVLLADGSVRTFGRNSSGQLGVGDTASRLTPVQVVSGFSSVLGRVAGGRYHTTVVMGDGTVRVFGGNNNGQLGLGDTVTRLTPVQISGLTSATAVACGQLHTAVILADGTVRTFGRNANGQLGVNDTTSRQTPVQVFGISSSATAVSCGWYQTAVLLADGTVRTFGYNNFGQLGVNDTTSRQTPVQVFGISSSAVAVASGFYHTAVLLADGTVRTFGFNGQGQLGINVVGGTRSTPVTVLNITSATAVACDGFSTVVLLANGTVRSFGQNNYGQLGVNDTTNRPTPVQVFGISSSATAIACGYYTTIVLLADGTVRSFGRNDFGQLGVGDLTQRLTPVQVFGISSSATAIACVNYHTLVLLADGSVRTVGRNNSGQLGVADTVNRLIPVKVGVSGNKVAGGAYHTAVVSNDGTVRTFGGNSEGQLGLGDTTSRLTPVQVTAFTSATVVACGNFHTAVLLADGTVRTFGSNSDGGLGINVSGGTRQTPVPVLNVTNATAVTAGAFHTVVLLADGTVRTFGFNPFGQLGINDTTSRQTPVAVLNISTATAVSSHGSHTAALLADGTVRTFGLNSSGQLGINDTTDRYTPVQVFGISSSATAIACGYYSTAVLLSNGTVRTFGKNNGGQLGVNDTTNRLTPVQVWGISSSATFVAVGRYHTAILLSDGTVRTFGRNSEGQLGVNDTTSRLTPVQVSGITSATALACGRYNSAILLQDGTVRTFGQNTNGGLGVNDTTSRLTPVQVIAAVPVAAPLQEKVAGGGSHTAVVMSDGTVRTFGNNGSGQLGVNVSGGTRQTPVTVLNITSATAVAGGMVGNTAILLSDGTVRTFGNNGSGQLGVNVSGGSRQTPVQVLNITSATAIASGGYDTVVLLADGTVRSFGSNSQGQLGVDDTTDRSTPVQVLNISTATAVSSGGQFTAVLLSNGSVNTFGRNNVGQLGINVSGGTRQTPVQVFGISSSAVAVACGNSGTFTAVLLADGTVRTFGYNAEGELGVNDTTSRQTPVQVFGISSSAVAIACGSFHTAVLLADGTVRTFGNNSQGQLGVNDTTQRRTPVQVFGISSSATAVACGTYFTAVLLADGTVRTFGRNNNAQLGVNDTTNRPTPVQVLNITTAVTPAPPAPITFITNATAIVVPLSSASTPITTFLLSTAAIITYPYIQFPALNLGPVQYPQYQLELTTDYARKLTTSTWTIGSDERLKTDIETANVDRCVEIVQNLDLKRFAWNFPDGSQTQDAHSLGWIAQEFAQFFPRSVEEAPAHGIMDFKNLNSDQIIKVMWGALKKLRADLKSQKSSDSELSTADDNASPTPE